MEVFLASGRVVERQYVTTDGGLIGSQEYQRRVANAAKPRTGKLYRRVDVSGVSGTGPVAWVVEFPDGSAALRWNKTRTGKPGSCTAYEYGVRQILDIHGHDGLTHVIWDD